MAAEDTSVLTSLHVNLRDKNNGSYHGQLVLKNWTLWYGEDGNLNAGPDPSVTKDDSIDDPTGASYYVIAVVLVYGMSIVMLIASHINRKHSKLIEDRQIHKYLQEFQVVQERSSQESYKDLKRKIKEQIQWDKEQSKANKYLQRNLSHAVLPMIAVTFPSITDAPSLTSVVGDAPRSRSSSVNSYASVGHSSPTSQPRSRANSFSELVGVHKHGRFLQIPDPIEVASSPRLTRERRKGLSNLLPTFPNQSMDTHHLENILEESLDSRHSSFRRKNSKKSTRSSSLTSIHEALRRLTSNDFDVARNINACNSIPELLIVDSTASEGPNSPDSGVGNFSNSNTPEVDIATPEEDTLHDTASDIDTGNSGECSAHAQNTIDDDVWVLNSDINSDDDEQKDEAYGSGRYSANRFYRVPPSVHTYSNRGFPQSSDRLLPNRYNRLSPLHDCEESDCYSESSSDSEDGGLLYVTCV